MLSAAEKKLILVGSAAVVALTAVCAGILISVKGDRHEAAEPANSEVAKGEFPMRYFQPDRRNYVSDDGNLAVIGPAWDKVRVENGKELYPIVVLHKRGEAFLEPYILRCGMEAGEKGGAFKLTCENVVLEDTGDDVTFTYSDGDERITVRLTLVSAAD